MLRLMAGHLQGARVQARGISFQGLAIDAVALRSEPISIDITPLLQGRPLQLRQRFQVEPQESLSTLLARFVWSCGVLFGGLIGIGGFLLHQQFNGWGGLAVLVGSWLLLRRLPQQNGARIV